MKKPAKPRNPVVRALLKAPRHGGAHTDERQQTRQQAKNSLRRQMRFEEVCHSGRMPAVATNLFCMLSRTQRA